MINSISDGTNPTDPVTRQQLVTLLHRYAQFKGLTLTGGTDIDAFLDHSSVADYAREAMDLGGGQRNHRRNRQRPPESHRRRHPGPVGSHPVPFQPGDHRLIS